MPPKVTVIIPTYNRAKLLSEAIDSVLNQTFQDFEIIIADGSSTDNTRELVQGLGLKVKYFNQKHTGLPASERNLGLRNASGEYIAFLDSDDKWLPNKLEIQINYFKSNPDRKIVYSNAYIIDESGIPTGKLLIAPSHAKEGEIFINLLKEDFIPTPTVIMEREVFEKVGYFNEDPAIRGVEDYEYWLRASMEFAIGKIPEPLALYRMHMGGISCENRSAAGKRQYILRSLLNKKYELNTNIANNINRLYFSTAVDYWRKSETLKAKKDIKKYISHNLLKLHIIEVVLGLLMYYMINLKYNNFIWIIKRFENTILKLI